MERKVLNQFILNKRKNWQTDSLSNLKAKAFQLFSGTYRVSVVIVLALFFGLSNTANAQVTYSENFNTGIGGWSTNWASTTALPCEGTNVARRNIYTTSTQGNFVSPSVGTSNGGAITMTFQYKITNWSAGTVATPATFGTINVQYSSSATGPWTTAYTIDAVNHTPSASCVTVTVPVFSAGPGAMYVQYECLYGTGDYYLYFDDINISQGAAPACVQPSALTATGITSSGASLAWTENGTATAWNIEYGASGFVQGAGTTTAVTANPSAVSALSANTTYDYYVQADCGAAVTSVWSGPFSFTTLPTCPDPSALTAANITTTSADLAWTSGSGLSSGEYGTVGFVPGAGTALGTTSPQSISGLLPATVYSFYVVDDCGVVNGMSDTAWSSFTTSIQGAVGVTCTTPGTSSSIVFSEEFDNNTATWTGNIGGSAGQWEIPDGSGSSSTGASSPHSGLNYMNVEASGFSTGNTASIVSPAIDLTTAADDAELSFWMHAYGAGMGLLNVGVATSATGPFTTVFTHNGQLQTSGTAPWQNVGVNLATYVGQTIYIEILMTSTTGQFTSDMSIDLFEVSSCIGCAPPTALTASNTTPVSADLAWTAGGTEAAWNVEYGAAGFTQGNGTVAPVVTNPYALSGLTKNTMYDYFVQANCGTSFSSWAGPFSFTTPPTCFPATALAGANITATTADLTWTSLSGLSNVEYGPAGFTPGTGTSTIGTTSPLAITGLTGNTNYDFYVVEDCGAIDGLSDTVFGSFTTPCTAFVAQYLEDWESTANVCWNQDALDQQNWTFDQNGTSSSNTGPSDDHTLGAGGGGTYIYLETSGGSTGDIANLTSSVDLSALTTPNLVFWYHMLGATMGTLSLDIESPLGSGTWTNVWTLTGDQGNQWLEATVDLSIYTGQTIGFRIQGVKGTSFSGDMAVDDLNFTDAVSCLKATASSATNITTTSADLTWTSLSGLSNVEYGPAGFTPGTGTSTIGTTSPLLATGLTGITAYDFYVVDDCGAGGTSDTLWGSFNTLCTVFAAPYLEDWETVANTCWTQDALDQRDWTFDQNGTSSSATGPSDDHTLGTAGGGTYIYLETSSGSTGDTANLTAPIDLSALTTPNLSFWYHMYGATMGTLNLDIESPVGSGTWTNVWTLSGDQGNQWLEAVVDLSAYTGQTVGFRIQGLKGTSFTGDMAIDDLNFREAPLSVVDLPITFDDATVNYDLVSFGAAIDSIIIDPTDPTNMVLRQDKPVGAQTWAGTTLGGSGIANAVPFAVGSTFMNARVWSPDSGTAILLKVEDAANGALSVETMAYTTAAGTWETLNFDFTNNSAGTPVISFTTVYDKVNVFCDFNTGGNGKTFYVDDVQFGAFLSQVDLPITFDDATVNYDLVSFGAAIDSIIIDPTDPANMVLRQDKPVGAQTWAGTTLGGSGLANAVPFAVGSTFMTARIWSPDSGTVVLLKVEDATNGALSVETTALTTAAGVWETLAFDFTNNSAGTPAISFTTTYDKVSVFCDFNTGGSGKTFYVDDVEFGAPPCAVYTAPFTESFDGSTTPACWSQTAVAGGPWVFTGSTNSVNCTAASDNTGNGGSFAWMDHSGADDSVSLLMPVVDVSSLNIAWLEFEYWMCGVGYSPINPLYIDTWNGTSWVTAGSITVATAGWEKFGFDLSAFTYGANLLQVRLRTMSGGSPGDFYGDPAIDDLTVDEKPSNCPITDIVTVNDQTSCGPSPVTFSASYTSQFGMLAWMNSDSAVVQTGGINYTTQPITATTDYTAQVYAADGSAAQHVGPLTNIATSGYGNFTNGQWFSVLNDFVLDSITVNSNGSTEFIVQISESGTAGAGNLLQVSDTIAVTGAGDHQVAVNLFLRPGNYFINVGFVTGTTGQLFRATSGAVFPYTINNVVSIDSVNFGGTRMYYAFDWVVSTVCTGPIETFQAIQGAIPSTSFPYAENFDSGLPCNWTTDALATGADWMNVVDYNGSSIDATNFMFIDDDAAGSSAITEASMISPVFNSQGYDTLFIKFDHYFRATGASAGYVEVYDGATWVTIDTFTSTSKGSWLVPAQEAYDITMYQNTDLQVRFRYDDGGAFAWYWAVDNFEMDGLQTPCTNVVVDILTDSWGSETTWSIVNTSTGTAFASGGPYPDGVLTNYVDTICLPMGVFFEFRLNDSYGDGLFDGANTGTYTVDILCPWGNNNVISGIGAFPFGGAVPLPNPSWDSVVFEVTCAQPGCFDPILVSDSVNCSTLFVDWISDTTATTRMEYGITGFTPGSGTLVNAITAPYTLTGLTNSATYDYYLVDSCSNGNISDSVWGTQFTTDPLPTAGFIKSMIPPAGRLDTVEYAFNAAPSQNETLQVWNYGDGSPLDTGMIKSHFYTSNGTFDVILYVYNNCGVDSDTQEVVISTVDIDEFGINNFALYPNPNKGRFTLNGTLDVGGEIQIQVLSMTGALVHSQKINTGQQIDVDIDLTGEASGVYQVRLISAKGVSIKPFVIQE